jgi:hypothetical protein
MKYGKVRRFDLKSPEFLLGSRRVIVHEKPMFNDDFKENDGSFPCCISPDEYPEGKPHFWFETYDFDGHESLRVNCDLLFIDDEYDGFFVQAQHWHDEVVQVRMHSTHHTWFSQHLLQRITWTLRHAEIVLPLLYKALQERLNIKEVVA